MIPTVFSPLVCAVLCHSPFFLFHSSVNSLFRAASTSIGGFSLVAQWRAPCRVMPARRPTSAAVARPCRISATPISRGVFMNASQSSEVQLSLHLMWLIYSSLVERQEHKIEQNLKFLVSCRTTTAQNKTLNFWAQADASGRCALSLARACGLLATVTA